MHVVYVVFCMLVCGLFGCVLGMHVVMLVALLVVVLRDFYVLICFMTFECVFACLLCVCCVVGCDCCMFCDCVICEFVLHACVCVCCVFGCVYVCIVYIMFFCMHG